ncbi:MAG: leucine-rich repeat-containing protein kinase family protein [Leptolyngbyaceae bacterium]|nr:leucine-rich repeat-containing protein kinase family protein [Leptolyngbyaceae bacterium]
MVTLEALKSDQLTGQKRLSLSENLTEIPSDLFKLADSLEILDLSNNQLSTLPDSFSQLRNLKIVFFNNNQFEEFPSVLAQCPNLSMVSFKNNRIARIEDEHLSPTFRWLTLTNNCIERLPPTIGTLSKLQKLMLAGNRLRTLPKELTNCKNLELIRLSANQLSDFPTELLTLPRLTWLAYAGNPFCQQTATVMDRNTGRSLPTIDWSELKVCESLGQGASGVIYKGKWTPPHSTSPTPTPQDVAIKLFKGEMTSDGSPLDEMQACLAAGNHPNLVTLLGKLAGHPDKKAGLIFSILPSTYTPLGHPPSLDSCTRDTYPEGTVFSISQILTIAQGMASVVAHLHDRGMMHGDLYAHNILVSEKGDSILSDFGAASFYDTTPPHVGTVLEKLEVRALGCLLDDLLTRCIPIQDSESAEAALFHRLHRLQLDCMSPVLVQRPRFRTICDGLTHMGLNPSA